MSSDLPPLTIPIQGAAKEGLCLLEAIQRNFGRDLAEIAWKALASRRFYVPHMPSAQHQLSRIIGADKAALIGSEMGGVTVEVPGSMRLRHRRVIRLHKAGVKYSDIASKTGYSERAVYLIVREARAIGLLPPRRTGGSGARRR